MVQMQLVLQLVQMQLVLQLVQVVLMQLVQVREVSLVFLLVQVEAR